MKLNSLTNVRPTYDQGCQIVAAPTEGGFKLSIEAAGLLGVTNGDRVDVAEHPAQPGTFFIGKGYEDRENQLINGGKIKKSGSYFLFSASAAWHKMGDTEHNTHYDVSTEPVEVDDDNFPDAPRTYYAITSDKKVPKQQSDTNEAKEYEETEATELEDATIQEADSPIDPNTQDPATVEADGLGGSIEDNDLREL